MSPQQPVYTRSEWMDGSDEALGPIGDIRDAAIQLEAGDWKGGAAVSYTHLDSRLSDWVLAFQNCVGYPV